MEIATNEAKFEAVRRLWIEMDRKGMSSEWDSLDDRGVSDGKPRWPSSPLPTGQPMAKSATLKGFSSVHKAEAVVGELMKLNLRVKPNSTTILLLLQHLRSMAKCGESGVWLVARYKRLYGNEVGDERVGLRLGRSAVKQNNPTVLQRPSHLCQFQRISDEVQWPWIEDMHVW